MPTATLTRRPPAQWRVLLKLFERQAAYHVGSLMKEQGAGPDQMIALEADNLILARIGENVPIRFSDLKGDMSFVTLRVNLASAGKNLLIRTGFINAICVLAGQPDHTARVRDLRAEGTATDEVLRTMAQQGLIKPADGSEASTLTAFKELPRDLKLKLTPKGRQYYPR